MFREPFKCLRPWLTPFTLIVRPYYPLPQALAERQAWVLRTLISEEDRPLGAGGGKAAMEESQRQKALAHIKSGMAEGIGIGELVRP